MCFEGRPEIDSARCEILAEQNVLGKISLTPYPSSQERGFLRRTFSRGDVRRTHSAPGYYPSPASGLLRWRRFGDGGLIHSSHESKVHCFEVSGRHRWTRCLARVLQKRSVHRTW